MGGSSLSCKIIRLEEEGIGASSLSESNIRLLDGIGASSFSLNIGALFMGMGASSRSCKMGRLDELAFFCKTSGDCSFKIGFFLGMGDSSGFFVYGVCFLSRAKSSLSDRIGLLIDSTMTRSWPF